MKNPTEYSIEDLDKIITGYNKAVESGVTVNIRGGSLFYSEKPTCEAFIPPHVNKITIPTFKKYMEHISSRSKSSTNPLAYAITNGHPLEEIQKLLRIHKLSEPLLHQDEDGNTLVHLAIATDSQTACLLQLVKALSGAAIGLYKVNKFDMDASHMALASNKLQLLPNIFFNDIGDGYYLRIWNANLEKEQNQAEKKSSDSCDFS